MNTVQRNGLPFTFGYKINPNFTFINLCSKKITCVCIVRHMACMSLSWLHFGTLRVTWGVSMGGQTNVEATNCGFVRPKSRTHMLINPSMTY